MSIDEPFEADALPPAAEGPLVVDLEGYEGPLDVLLALARAQKVDLPRISWLAYLKSRLLLPEVPEDDELTGPEMAARLAFQLRRLEAMREAAARLMAGDRLGREVFARGAPEGVRVIKSSVFEASLYDLLKAYADHRTRQVPSLLRISPAAVYSVDAALGRLREMLGATPDWQTLERFLPTDLAEGVSLRSAVAAIFVASLELVRQGRVELRQGSDFGPLYIRRVEQKAKSEE